MLSRLFARATATRLRFPHALRRPNWRTSQVAALSRRLAHFWVVWSALLFVHEAGHALTGRRQGLVPRRVTVGVGPVLWRGQVAGTEGVLRLLPVAGVTTFAAQSAGTVGGVGWTAWGRQVVTLAGGVLATLALAIGVAGAVALRERSTRARSVFGRILIADAVVLTVFNFLPVPPLDGGRAVVGALTAWRGVPLSPDALFWVHAGGLALAVVPMMLWTRWTARIDSAAMRWGAPSQVIGTRGRVRHP